LPTILPALEKPLGVPVVYNCGGYESAQTLRALKGKIDIYLPDLKYADNTLAQQLSGASNYFETATAAIKEMVQQVGDPVWEDQRLRRGVVIRHLILPGHTENSLKVLDWIGEHFAPGQVLVSLMRQYTPMPGMPAPFDRQITEEEYQSVLSWMFLNGLDGFTQEADSANANYIPDFNRA
jgi:putative pyruvate formate lyase activating enzyme